MISKASTAAFYPTLEPAIDVLDEIRPVDVKLREIETNQRAVLLRLPESDQVKSNVRRVAISGLTPGIRDIQVSQPHLENFCIFAGPGNKLPRAKE